MGKFKVGDRVRFTADAAGAKLTGKTGTVIPDKKSAILKGEGTTVHLDEPVEDIFGGGKKDWYWAFDYKLELISPNKPEKQPVIVITSDGKTTTATKRIGKQVICSATARCSDDDPFDFNTGAKIAFERLLVKEWPVPEEEPEPKEFKVVCSEVHGCGVGEFTPGRIYTIEREGDELRVLGDWARSFPGGHRPRYWADLRRDGKYLVQWSADSKAVFIPFVED